MRKNKEESVRTLPSGATDKKLLRSCFRCRSRKQKCDKARPCCRRCARNSLVCQYSDNEKDDNSDGEVEQTGTMNKSFMGTPTGKGSVKNSKLGSGGQAMTLPSAPDVFDDRLSELLHTVSSHYVCFWPDAAFYEYAASQYWFAFKQIDPDSYSLSPSTPTSDVITASSYAGVFSKGLYLLGDRAAGRKLTTLGFKLLFSIKESDALSCSLDTKRRFLFSISILGSCALEDQVVDDFDAAVQLGKSFYRNLTEHKKELSSLGTAVSIYDLFPRGPIAYSTVHNVFNSISLPDPTQPKTENLCVFRNNCFSLAAIGLNVNSDIISPIQSWNFKKSLSMLSEQSGQLARLIYYRYVDMMGMLSVLQKVIDTSTVEMLLDVAQGPVAMTALRLGMVPEATHIVSQVFTRFSLRPSERYYGASISFCLCMHVASLTDPTLFQAGLTCMPYLKDQFGVLVREVLFRSGASMPH